MQKGGFLGFGQGAYFSEFSRGKGAAGEALQKKHDLKQLLNCVQTAKKCLRGKEGQSERAGVNLSAAIEALQDGERELLGKGNEMQARIDELKRAKKDQTRQAQVGGGRRGTRSKTHRGRKNYTTKRGDKVFHRRRHYVRRRRRPYTRRRPRRATRGTRSKTHRGRKNYTTQARRQGFSPAPSLCAPPPSSLHAAPLITFDT